MTNPKWSGVIAALLYLFGSSAWAISELEPNDSCQSAQSIGSVPAKSVSGSIDSGDIDYFKLAATPGSFITIDIKGSASGAGTITNTSITAFSGSCIKLTQSSASSGEARLLVEVPSDGKLRLAAAGLSGSTGTYKMTVTAPVGLYGKVTQKGSSVLPTIGYVSFSICQDPLYEFCAYYYSTSATLQIDYTTRTFFVDTAKLAAAGRYELAVSGYSQAGELAVWRSAPLDLVTGQSQQLSPELEPMPAQISAVSTCPSPIAAGATCQLQYQVTNTTTQNLDIELRASIQISSGAPVSESTFDIGSKGGPVPILKSISSGQATTVTQSLNIPGDVPSGSRGTVSIYAYHQGAPQVAIGRLNILYFTVGSSSASQ